MRRAVVWGLCGLGRVGGGEGGVLVLERVLVGGVGVVLVSLLGVIGLLWRRRSVLMSEVEGLH